MKSTAPRTKRRNLPRAVSLALGAQHTLEVTAGPDVARLQLTGAAGAPGLSLEIVLTPQGPSLRVQAPSVELVAEESLTTRCKHLHLEASESVRLSTKGALEVDAAAVTVEAHTGAVKLHANDDVQLLGEQVLLNCERQPELPPWAQVPPADPPPLLPRRPASGDAQLLLDLGEKPVP
jgi:uncharacterized protein (DUF2345 family)